jgi:3-phenylpropionate/cinnamic acid dioxygenase small subunit
MHAEDALGEATALLYQEAECLDESRWEEWLALYLPDCEFWVPTWIDDGELSSDPRTQLSLIYYDARDGLADRVRRIRSGTSVASMPRPRTMHAITNIRLAAVGPGRRVVHSNFSVDVYDLRRQESSRLFGYYEHELRAVGEGWKFARKKVTVLNDRLPPVVDVYSL